MRSLSKLIALALAVTLVRPVFGASLEDLVEGGEGVVVDPLKLKLQRQISRGLDFPATATTPGFTYQYDPELDAFKRTSASLGPAFLERADTVGKGRFDVGLSMLWAAPDEIDGDDLQGFTRTVLKSEGQAAPRAIDMTYDEYDMDTFAWYASSTYGVTNRFDVNILLPVFLTSLSVRSRQFTTETGAFIDDFSGDESKFGVGDLQLRGKYLLQRSDPLGAALGLALRFPTGDEDNFQSIGDYTVTPSGVVSYVFGRNDVHASAGVEINTDKLERSRMNYGVGISAGIIERLTANLDVIGNSQFDDEIVDQSVDASAAAIGSQVNSISDVIGVIPTGPQSSIVRMQLDRTDIIDVAVGVKFAVVGSLVAFVSAIVPITDDGVRADVVPAGGLEMSF